MCDSNNHPYSRNKKHHPTTFLLILLILRVILVPSFFSSSAEESESESEEWENVPLNPLQITSKLPPPTPQSPALPPEAQTHPGFPGVHREKEAEIDTETSQEAGDESEYQPSGEDE